MLLESYACFTHINNRQLVGLVAVMVKERATLLAPRLLEIHFSQQACMPTLSDFLSVLDVLSGIKFTLKITHSWSPVHSTPASPLHTTLQQYLGGRSSRVP